METKFFSVYDSAAARYLDPFVAPTPDVAIRGFKQAVNREGHQFNLYPADYTLFLVGDFDPEKGIVIPCNPTNLGNAVSFLEHGQQLSLPMTEAVNDA